MSGDKRDAYFCLHRVDTTSCTYGSQCIRRVHPPSVHEQVIVAHERRRALAALHTMLTTAVVARRVYTQVARLVEHALALGAREQLACGRRELLVRRATMARQLRRRGERGSAVGADVRPLARVPTADVRGERRRLGGGVGAVRTREIAHAQVRLQAWRTVSHNNSTYLDKMPLHETFEREPRTALRAYVSFECVGSRCCRRH